MVISKLDRTVALTRAFGNPARLRIAAMLHTGDLCVCQITEVLGLAPSTVSAHLREVGLGDEPDARPWIESALTAVEGDRQITADAALIEELRRLPVEDLCRLGLTEARARQASRASHREAVGT